MLIKPNKTHHLLEVNQANINLVDQQVRILSSQNLITIRGIFVLPPFSPEWDTGIPVQARPAHHLHFHLKSELMYLCCLHCPAPRSTKIILIEVNRANISLVDQPSSSNIIHIPIFPMGPILKSGSPFSHLSPLGEQPSPPHFKSLEGTAPALPPRQGQP